MTSGLEPRVPGHNAQLRFQLFPDLRPDEYEALKADIAKRGILVPVEVDQNGEVLDGHHRLKIAGELGIEAPTTQRTFESDDERKDFILKINLLRRHLGPVAWARAYEQLAEVRGIDLGSGKGDPSGKADSASALAEEMGVTPRTARRRRKVARSLKSQPDLAEKVDAGEMEVKRALRVKRERESAAKDEASPPPEPNREVANLHVGDLRTVLHDLPDNTVDLIFTDPPYPEEYLKEWDALGFYAQRWLKPGGLLVAYSGQRHLLAVLSYLSKHLDYLWLGSLLMPGAHNQVHQFRIHCRAKPILFFSKGRYKLGEWFDDTYLNEAAEKDEHPWQQSVAPAAYYIEKLTKPGDLVLDPFLGTGTTAIAACGIGRRFIGCDVDDAKVRTAKRRLASESL